MYTCKDNLIPLLYSGKKKPKKTKNLWFPKETVWGVEGCPGGVGWKSYKIGL